MSLAIMCSKCRPRLIIKDRLSCKPAPGSHALPGHLAATRSHFRHPGKKCGGLSFPGHWNSISKGSWSIAAKMVRLWTRFAVQESRPGPYFYLCCRTVPQVVYHPATPLWNTSLAPSGERHVSSTPPQCEYRNLIAYLPYIRKVLSNIEIIFCLT